MVSAFVFTLPQPCAVKNRLTTMTAAAATTDVDQPLGKWHPEHGISASEHKSTAAAAGLHDAAAEHKSEPLDAWLHKAAHLDPSVIRGVLPDLKAAGCESVDQLRGMFVQAPEALKGLFMHHTPHAAHKVETALDRTYGSARDEHLRSQQAAYWRPRQEERKPDHAPRIRQQEERKPERAPSEVWRPAASQAVLPLPGHFHPSVCATTRVAGDTFGCRAAGSPPPIAAAPEESARAAALGFEPFVLGPPPLVNKSVLLFIVGDAFRRFNRTRGNPACRFASSESVAGQHEAMRSYVRNVILPLEAHGARVHALLSVNRCPEVFASAAEENTTMDSMRGALVKWLGARRVIGYREIDSATQADGWRLAAEQLEDVLLDGGGAMPPFDYILQARYDILIERPITLWPANFSTLLLEREGYDCSPRMAGCIHGGKEALVHHLGRPSCGPCHDDHLLWMPRRFVPLINHALLHGAHGGHGLALSLARADPRIASESAFMFPPECGDFPIMLSCGEFGAYRPARLHPGTQEPFPSPSDWFESEPEARPWRTAFVDERGLLRYDKWRMRAVELSRPHTRMSRHRWPPSLARPMTDLEWLDKRTLWRAVTGNLTTDESRSFREGAKMAHCGVGWCYGEGE